MFRRFRLFLGPARLNALFFLLAFTGFGNLILNIIAQDVDWARPAQSALVALFLVGAAVIIGGRLTPSDRARWSALLAPAFGAILIGVLFVPDRLGLLMGLAFGWILAGLFLFRPRGPMQYQQAVRLLRKSQYADAVQVMDDLIKAEPAQPNHYRFRAEILRVWGKLDRARRDYEKMTQLDPNSAVAFNGLAEVNLQMQAFEAAHEAALKAYDLAPQEWVAAYNLGMIEDRLKKSDAVIEHLNLALRLKVPDARHRLLIHFYLARAYARSGDLDSAREQVDRVRKHPGGFNEWQIIINSPQAATLRAVIGDDITAAGQLIAGQLGVRDLV